MALNYRGKIFLICSILLARYGAPVMARQHLIFLIIVACFYAAGAKARRLISVESLLNYNRTILKSIIILVQKLIQPVGMIIILLTELFIQEGRKARGLAGQHKRRNKTNHRNK